MRDHLLFHVNGRRCRVGGEAAFSSLTDFLRAELHLTGTKVVCAEGDCGACTVLVGRPEGERLRYETVDACIQFLYQLDGKHVVTVEGLKHDGRLHPVQEAMIAAHGSQCGYCTPGFVMALAGLCQENGALDGPALRLGLTGNLCRCTGYLPILEAAAGARQFLPPERPYGPPALFAELAEHARDPLLIETSRRTFFRPSRLDDALDFKARHPDAVIVSGNTELGVLRNKKCLDPPRLLSLTGLAELSEIVCADGVADIGANVTWTQIEHFARERLPAFYPIVVRFGSPQIRNVATLVGNVANGSPIADALPFLYVMGAEVELARAGGHRRVRIDQFYRGYKVKDLAADEIITRVRVPLPAPRERLRLYKVSRRNDLDIATFGAAVRLRCSSDRIEEACLAYSGVAPTVVRLPDTEDFLQGKPFAEETFAEAGRVARAKIDPITDVRGSRDYRLQLAENILCRFYLDCAEDAGERGMLIPRCDGDGGLVSCR
jgi:xanthine dehydrogenase small subunit